MISHDTINNFLNQGTLHQIYPDGRNYLCELSQDSSKKAELAKAVEKFLKDIKFFNTTCDLIQAGHPSFYNYDTHKFDIKSAKADEQDLARAKRDYMVDCIRQFAKIMFPKKTHKVYLISQFLTYKLMKNTSSLCEYDYIDSAALDEQRKGEKSLIKFLEKIKEGKLLSQQQKEIKQSLKQKSDSTVQDEIKVSFPKVSEIRIEENKTQTEPPSSIAKEPGKNEQVYLMAKQKGSKQTKALVRFLNKMKSFFLMLGHCIKHLIHRLFS